MKFLALDTCTEACSVALILDEQVTGEYQVVGNRHSEVLLDMVHRLLAAAHLGLGQLDAIGFSRGPGSFTGVRIGTGVVQGLALGAELPVLPVSSLALLAQGAAMHTTHPWLLPLLDARMGEVYWAGYHWSGQGPVTAITAEQVAPAEVVGSTLEQAWHAFGPGAAPYRQQFPTHILVPGESSMPCEPAYPDARCMGPLLSAAWQGGQAVAPEQAWPVYLRNNVALKAKGAS